MTDSNPSKPEPPVITVPTGIVDRAGRRLRPGNSVRTVDGIAGEVVGYRGFDGVEVLSSDDDLFAIAPDQVLRAEPDDRFDSVTLGIFVVQEESSITNVVFPVGSRDVQTLRGANLGPFPDPDDFSKSRTGGGREISARDWGLACLEAVANLSSEEAASLVALHLDAPILRRVLVEASLPVRIHRLTFIVTEQVPSHPNDTEPFGRLLQLWSRGTEAIRRRKIDTVNEPLVLSESPHLLEPVLFACSANLAAFTDGAEQLAVVQAGGTPSMAQGCLLAAALGSEIPIRHIQVPLNQPIVEADFPALRRA